MFIRNDARKKAQLQRITKILTIFMTTESPKFSSFNIDDYDQK